jgi:hypothetical protein
MSTPDPILPLADFPAAAAFASGGITGRVIPQRVQAGSVAHHPQVFYIESPAESGTNYQVHTSILLRILGDGATTRRFNAASLAKLLQELPTGMLTEKLLKAISI